MQGKCGFVSQRHLRNQNLCYFSSHSLINTFKKIRIIKHFFSVAGTSESRRGKRKTSVHSFHPGQMMMMVMTFTMVKKKKKKDYRQQKVIAADKSSTPLCNHKRNERFWGSPSVFSIVLGHKSKTDTTKHKCGHIKIKTHCIIIIIIIMTHCEGVI